MARPTPLDELFVHQIPELLPNVATPPRRTGGRASSSSSTAPTAPAMSSSSRWPTTRHAAMLDSLQMGRVGGDRDRRPTDPAVRRRPAHHAGRRRCRIEVVEPCEEIHLWADPDAVRHRARPHLHAPAPSRTGCAGARCGPATSVVWDQSHMLQSGHVHRHVHRRPARPTTSTGGSASATTRGASATTAAARCGCGSRSSSPDGFLGVWHWEFANGARVYTDGCWAGTDGSDPVPVSTSSTTWSGSAPTASPPSTASTATTWPACAAGARSRWPTAGGSTVEAEGTLRPARTSRSTAAGSTRCGSRTDDGRDRHGDLRGHRRPPPPLLPRHHRHRRAARLRLVGAPLDLAGDPGAGLGRQPAADAQHPMTSPITAASMPLANRSAMSAESPMSPDQSEGVS